MIKNALARRQFIQFLAASPLFAGLAETCADGQLIKLQGASTDGD